MRTLGIIPARAGSKRLPGKNKKLLAGKELVRYTIEMALKASTVTDWVLTTDDEDILQIGREYAELIVIPRPANIAGDTAAAITYVEHALSVLPQVYSYTVIVQVTSPFTLAEDVDGTIALLQKRPEAASAVSIQKLDFAVHPVKLKELDSQSFLQPFLEEEAGRMSAQQLPEIYVRNGSVYVSTIAAIKQGEIVSEPCLGYLMPRERSLDINDPIDFSFAEFLMSQRKQ